MKHCPRNLVPVRKVCVLYVAGEQSFLEYTAGDVRNPWLAGVSFAAGEGQRTFQWEYSKDGSGSSGDDTGWIDDVVFPVN